MTPSAKLRTFSVYHVLFGLIASCFVFGTPIIIWRIATVDTTDMGNDMADFWLDARYPELQITAFWLNDRADGLAGIIEIERLLQSRVATQQEAGERQAQLAEYEEDLASLGAERARLVEMEADTWFGDNPDLRHLRNRHSVLYKFLGQARKDEVREAFEERLQQLVERVRSLPSAPPDS